MSGYPIKTPYDADKKRKKYLEELALRARLDNENLQANKLYKRTGAISTPPDTRTTTEKLSDVYRLRIDIRSKLGQLMSGDDAQKVVNRLDAQELAFLSGRIDRYIAELKPKYSMGMPYQAFIKFFKDAVSNFMAYGDIDLNSAAVFENVAKTEELKNSIDEMIRELQLAGKKDLILKIDGLDEFYDLINQAKIILPNVADPNLQQNIEASLIAIENIPTAYEIDDLRSRYEQAVRTGSVVREQEIARELEQKIEAVNQLEAEKEALKQNLENLRQDVAQQAASKLSGIPTYYDDFIPITDESQYTNNSATKIFEQMMNVSKLNDSKSIDFIDWRRKQGFGDRIRTSQGYVNALKKDGGMANVNNFLKKNKDFINDFMELELNFPDVTIIGPPDSSSGSSSGSSSTPASQTINNQVGIRLGIQAGSQSGSKSSSQSGSWAGSKLPSSGSSSLGSLFSSPSSSGSATPMVQSQSDLNDKVNLLKEYFDSKGTGFLIEMNKALRKDTAKGNSRAAQMNLMDVLNKTDIIDVPDLIPKFQSYLDSLIDGSWNSSGGYFSEYLRYNQPRLTPKSTTPKTTPKITPRASPTFAPPSPSPTLPPSSPILPPPSPTQFTPITQQPSFDVEQFALDNEPKLYGRLMSIQKKFENDLDDQLLNDYTLFFISLTKKKLSIDEGFKQMINDYMTDNISNLGSFDDIIEFLTNYLKEMSNDIKNKKFPPTSIEEFGNRKKSGSGLKRMKRMKGGSVRIDVNAGMRDDTNIPKYVPFGRYIINRNKLNDGVVMIKRPNGAFMGDLQSRRVSNNLRNIFEKVVGGSIPTYQDLSKLDEDEKQYLHYVSKKANLVDKLQVPTPNKDEEEKMINRYEILRGQIVAGNDNKEMIKEFKKLLLDMSDRKLLPRRQVSDILIDIEKMYG